MTLLGAGVRQIPENLHPAVLALLTGLNAAAVGLIALAAEQLGNASATDRITLAIVWLSASFGICHHAPWMYPSLIVAGGATTLAWDYRRVWLTGPIRRITGKQAVSASVGAAQQEGNTEQVRGEGDQIELEQRQSRTLTANAANVDEGEAERGDVSSRVSRASTSSRPVEGGAEEGGAEGDTSTTAIITSTPGAQDPLRVVPFGVSYALIAAFVLMLAIPLSVRGGLENAGKEAPRALSVSLRCNMGSTPIGRAMEARETRPCAAVGWGADLPIVLRKYGAGGNNHLWWWTGGCPAATRLCRRPR